MRLTRHLHSVDNGGVALGRRIGVDEFATDGNTSSLGYRVALRVDRIQHGVTAVPVSVADIHFDAGSAGDTIDRTGENLTDADGADGIDGICGLHAAFHCQCDFGRTEKGVAALRHEYRTGVAAFPVDPDLSPGRCCDCGNDADIDPALFEERALFDVQFHECGVGSRLQTNAANAAVKAG